MLLNLVFGWLGALNDPLKLFYIHYPLRVSVSSMHNKLNSICRVFSISQTIKKLSATNRINAYQQQPQARKSCKMDTSSIRIIFYVLTALI